MSMPSPFSQLDGVLVVRKPEGPTSTDCLNTIKRQLGQKKIGHAGTLDPMATGVLVVLLGQATKLAGYLSEDRKTYKASLILGQTTDSYDRQGRVLSESPWQHISPDDVRAEILSWDGAIRQEVPPVSAAKHQGKPLYALHRAGKEVPVKVKEIVLYRVEILDLDLPRVTFRVTCSAGTYIRALAHSLGTRLGCGAVLCELEREASHPFTLEHAHALDDVLTSGDQLQHLLIPMAQALPHWPKLTLDGEQEKAVRNGGRLPARLFPEYPAQDGDRVLLLGKSGTPVALAEALQDGELSWSILRGLWPS